MSNSPHHQHPYHPPKPGIHHPKPGKVQAVSTLTLVGGIYGIVFSAILLLWAMSTCVCLLWPGIYYSLVMAIMATIKGSQLVSVNDQMQEPPLTVAIMMIVNILNADVVNLGIGIALLVLCNDPEVKQYYGRL